MALVRCGEPQQVCAKFCEVKILVSIFVLLDFVS